MGQGGGTKISINDIEVETSKGLISHSPLPSPNFTALLTTRSDITNRETPSSIRNDVGVNSVPLI